MSRLPTSPIASDPMAAALQSWEKHEQATDLLVCVSCGFVGCFSDGHFSLHLQTHPKHFVGLQLASKTFWCEPCNMDIPRNVRPKVEKARQDFCDAVEELAAKKRRQIRNQMRAPQTNLSPITTPNGSANNLVDLDTHADTPPVPRGALTLDKKEENGVALLSMPLRTKARDDKVRRRMLKTAMKREPLQEINIPEQDPSSLELPNTVLGPLLNMPLRTKARDDKIRRRMLKTAMKREPLQEINIPEQDPSSLELPNTVLGFTNLGNTCYFNASMQALLTATHYFPEHTHIEEVLETKNTPITTTFTMLHETVKKRARKALAGESTSDRRARSKSGRSRSGSSSVLTVAPLLKEMRCKFSQFRGHYQQDAHELFTSFLWAIDEEMDPPLPSADEPAETPPKPVDSVTNSSCSTANSSELPDDDDDSSRRNGTWPEEDTTDGEQTEEGEQEAEEDGSESDADNSEQEDTKQIFVKTETGETISMQVPKSATVKEVQHLLAKRLNLNEEDMMLDASKVETRATLSSRPSAVLHARAEKRKMYSRLNFTRNLFGGALTTAVTCKGCGKRTEIVEDAFHLSVSVPDGRHHELTTMDCLDNFVTETQLLVEANNGYDCEKCSRQPKVRSVAGRFMRKKRLGSNAEPEMEVVLRDASMQLFMSALPRVLVVHIKRLARSRKITQHIAFNEKLDMTPYVSETLRQGGGDAKKHSLCYELIAVVVHMGNKRSGHYVAYVSRSRRREAVMLARARSRLASEEGAAVIPDVTTPRNGEGPSRTWYYVSDTVVKRVSFEQVLQCEAYMLFYQRRPKASASKTTPTSSPTAETERLPKETALICACASECLFTGNTYVVVEGWKLRASSEDMSDAREESIEETLVDSTDASALNVDKFLDDEAEEMRWREKVDKQRAAMGDAEDTCVFLIDDLLLAIFQEMQVRSENATLFAMSSQQMCAQAFEAVDMSALESSESLDRIRRPTEHELNGRQQVLKLQSKWISRPQQSLSSSISALVLPPPILFLRRLLNFLEHRADRANLELQRFPSSKVISSYSSKCKLVGNERSKGDNEWCIPVEMVPAFLQVLITKGVVSAVPSTIVFVMAVNREAVNKKMHSHVRVTLSHLQQFVQKALLAAEEEEERKQIQPPVPEEKSKANREFTPWSRIFQTEVPLNKGIFGGTTRNGMTPHGGGPNLALLSSYLEEGPPRAVEMDRRAPGQVRKKTALGAANPPQRARSRKVMLLLAPPPRLGSRWKTVRHKLVAPPADATKCGVMTITAEADMELTLAGARNTTSRSSASVKRKATALPIQTAGVMTTEMPDAAALSNIFALGTPRQLSAHELARRNDLLAQLERETIHAQRRASMTFMASMSLDSPGVQEGDVVCSSPVDQQQFQAYVAANSTIMTGVEPSGRSGALSPTRPQHFNQGATTRKGRANVERSKFELEQSTLPFTVSDGNSHAREDQDTLSAALCSPIKRPRASVIAPPPPPETPERPIRTASMLAQLPQLDSSRLVVGVSAVKSMGHEEVQAANHDSNFITTAYAAFEGVDDPENEANGGGSQVLVSPVRIAAPPAKGRKDESFRLPMIPGVSPIKASPHRKHVAFKFQNDERIPATISPKTQMRQRLSAKTKQPVWETTTQSPPRTRNHHASSRNFRKIQQYEEESSSARRLKQEEYDSNISHQMFAQPMEAPRRTVIPSSSEYDEL
ncbi:Ubiquitin-specific protease [Phytophthora megakarya]|uniref:ubiquitinyl hydrolase 1 n=1 Tax=Phytophthora megakarya TaxID=4795 RepID=A0A225WP77_9STRA|nr:Ubiquitin-specific protease [Phytophthora megakarya]